MKTLQNIARLQEADKRNYSKYKNLQKWIIQRKNLPPFTFSITKPPSFFSFWGYTDKDSECRKLTDKKEQYIGHK